jgi:hypothetical protein
MPSDTSVRADILELLAGKYNMDVYIWGSDDDISNVLQFEFYELSNVIMSHQPLEVERVSTQHRFNIAMKLRGRSPTDFLATVGLGIDDLLLAMTDQLGANALHWAAMHWSIGHRRQWPLPRLKIYGDFTISLLKAGLPVSAIDRCCHTPFMYLLDWDDPPGGWSYGTWILPNKVCPEHIISSWGTLLQRAEVSLPEYVERENVLLSRIVAEHQVQFNWRGRILELQSVALSDQMTFTMRVKTVESYEKW